MTTPHPDSDAPALTDSSVTDYLRRHPDFFLRHELLLTDLELPHDAKGAVSLIERQVAVLRRQRQDLKHTLQQLTQTARDNEQLLERIEQLVLGLLETRDHEALLLRLRAGLCQDFHADAVELKLFGNHADEIAVFGRVIERGNPVCGHIAAPQAQLLFGEQATALRSGALIPLFAPHDTQCIGIIGIGSCDPHRFHAEMGTTFLRYLGAVVARLLQRAG